VRSSFEVVRLEQTLGRSDRGSVAGDSCVFRIDCGCGAHFSVRTVCGPTILRSSCNAKWLSIDVVGLTARWLRSDGTVATLIKCVSETPEFQCEQLFEWDGLLLFFHLMPQDIPQWQ
jgi:hypothetical protein